VPTLVVVGACLDGALVPWATGASRALFGDAARLYREDIMAAEEAWCQREPLTVERCGSSAKAHCVA
jgi:hypothetical protein